MISLYVHVPFCKHKCYYCDFYSNVYNKEQFEEYFTKLKDEINNYKEALNIKNSKPDFYTVYFGGGTPSVIPEEYIKEIMEMIHCDGEVTIEVNPGTITKEKLQAYKDAGINRLSIGLQTTNDKILKTIGRIHNLKDFEQTYNLAREVGFKNISVDLMFGLPNQTLKDVEDTLEFIIKFNPEHVSCYSLIVHDELKEKYPNAFINLPSDDIERKMYYLICEKLKCAGFNQYEISNFSKIGFESKHNLCYWNQEEYLGVGPSASSYINGIRYKNCSGDHWSPCNNQQSCAANHWSPPNAIIEEIQTPESKLREYMILKLRLIDGVSIKEANQKFNVDILNFFEKEITKLKNMSLLEQVDQNLRLTKKGLDFANIVWEEFI